jgi:hypothetical protein
MGYMSTKRVPHDSRLPECAPFENRERGGSLNGDSGGTKTKNGPAPRQKNHHRGIAGDKKKQ